MSEWINIEDQQPIIGQFACAPIPHLDNIISGKVSWNPEGNLFCITSMSGDIYYIMNLWMPLPELPRTK